MVKFTISENRLQIKAEKYTQDRWTSSVQLHAYGIAFAAVVKVHPGGKKPRINGTKGMPEQKSALRFVSPHRLPYKGANLK
jgi:hypothetical protein